MSAPNVGPGHSVELWESTALRRQSVVSGFVISGALAALAAVLALLWPLAGAVAGVLAGGVGLLTVLLTLGTRAFGVSGLRIDAEGLTALGGRGRVTGPIRWEEIAALYLLPLPLTADVTGLAAALRPEHAAAVLARVRRQERPPFGRVRMPVPVRTRERIPHRPDLLLPFGPSQLPEAEAVALLRAACAAHGVPLSVQVPGAAGEHRAPRSPSRGQLLQLGLLLAVIAGLVAVARFVLAS